MHAFATWLVIVSVIFGGQAAQAMQTTANTVALDVSPTAVSPDGKLFLQAGIPAADVGVSTQEIVMEIDPSKIQLHSIFDITAPVGWTLSYCSTAPCNVAGNFTTTVPANEAAWMAVRAVKATGSVDSQGVDISGKQIASKTSVDPTAPTGSFTGTASGGDGWDVFFDDRGFVFNIWHHDGANYANNGAIDCHLKNGTKCPGAWPLSLGWLHTGNLTGWVDSRTHKMWIPINNAATTGFLCVDVSVMTAANKWCGGSQATAYTELHTMGANKTTTCIFSGFGYYYGCTAGFAHVGNRVFTWDEESGLLLCLDVTLNDGLGAACANTPLAIPGITQANDNTGVTALEVWGPRLYGVTQGHYQVCFVAATMDPCPGWANPRVIANTSSGSTLKHNFMLLPNSTGAISAICTWIIPTATQAAFDCLDYAGNPYVLSATDSTALSTGQDPIWWAETGVSLSGSKVLWATWPSLIRCYDMATSDWCKNKAGTAYTFGGSAGKADSNYTLRVDPYNVNCVWTNADDGTINNWDISTGLAGCPTFPNESTFAADTVVPRMGCSAATAITAWRSFTLLGPASYTGATLTVKDSDDLPIAGWTDIAIPGSTAAPSTAIVNLSSLSTTLSGQNPKFVVKFGNRNGTDSAAASISAVGDAPELCLTPTAVLQCPAVNIGPITTPMLVDVAVPVYARASTISTGNISTALTPASSSSTIITKPNSLSLCGSTLSGVATETGASVKPIVGVTVNLLDSAGAPVLDGSGNPVTTTTNADGTYSFGYLVPNSYKVSFTEPTSAPLYNVANATTVSGATGTTAGTTTATVAATSATAPVVALAVGTNGVVNAEYLIPISATPDTTQGPVGAVQTATVYSNDIMSTGFAYSSIKLCLANETPNACTGSVSTSKLFVPGEGTYHANGNTLVFTPCSGVNLPTGASCTGPFTGTATPANYIVADNSGRIATSTYTPTVIPDPTLVNDTNTGPFNTSQIINPLANDAPASLTTLVPASTRLCGPSQVDPNCVATSVTVTGQGTYTVNTTTGVVTFVPLATFTGTATPVTYMVKDAIGNTATATITPTVTPPPVDIANPETTSGLKGAAQTIDILTNDTTPTGVSLTANTAKLCAVGETAPNCTKTTLIVPGVGVYVLNTAGSVTFTPCSNATTPSSTTYSGLNCTSSGFTGVATAVPYQVTDSIGRTISSTYTTTVIGPPTASADTNAGPYLATQVINPLVNDNAATGTTLNATTVKICATTTADASCTGTTLSVANQGTYTVNATTGAVTFAPCTAAATPIASCTGPFVGTATPIKYAVTDMAGQKVYTTITPTVLPPIPATITSDTSRGSWDVNQTISPLVNDVPTEGSTWTKSTLKLCSSGQTAPNCTATTLVVPNEGTYTVDPVTGQVAFNPLDTFSGTATPVSYQITDSTAHTLSSTITPIVTVAPPEADPQSVTVLAGQTATFTNITGANGLATAGGAPLVASATCLLRPGTSNCDADGVVTVAEGTYTLNTSTGEVSFVPVAGLAGGTAITTIDYRVTDLVGQTATATLTVITPPAPNASPNTSVGGFNSSQVISVLGNDSPGVASAPLDATTMKLCPVAATAPFTSTNCNETSVSVAGEGTYTISSAGIVTFVPVSGFTGTVATPVQYIVKDTLGQIATSIITPTVLPEPSTKASPDSGTAAWTPTVTVVIDPLTNDSAGLIPLTGYTTTGTGYTTTGSVALNPTSVKLCAANESAPNCTLTSLTTSEGTYTVNPTSGAITFDPISSFIGTATIIPTYQVCNAVSGAWAPQTPAITCASSTITTTITPPAAPVASPNTTSGIQGQAQSINLITNDNLNGVPLGQIHLCATGQTGAACNQTSLTVAGEGTYSIDSATGAVTFTPLPTFVGTATPISYSVSNSVGGVATSTYTPTVTPLVGPTATPNTKSTIPGVAVNFTNITGSSPLANQGSGAITASRTCLVDPANTSYCGTSVVTNDGVWSLDSTTGVASYTPNQNVSRGAQTPVSYVVTDVNGMTATSTLTPNVPAAPTASPDTSAGGVNVAQVINILANDSANSGPALDPTTVKFCDVTEVAPNCTLTTLVVAGKGTFTVNPTNGVVTFTPENNFVGPVPAITYSVANVMGEKTSSAITVLITTGPAANPDTTSGVQGATQTTTLITNDSAGSFPISSVALCGTGQTGAACDKLSLTVTGQGVYTLNPTTGEIAFVPDSGFVGTATPVNYVVKDSQGVTASSTYTPTVTPLPPVANPDTTSGRQGKRQSANLVTSTGTGRDVLGTYPLARAVLCDAGETGAGCSLTTKTVPGVGVYSVTAATGLIEFLPEPGFTGTPAAMPYAITDSHGQVASSTYTPTVTPTAPPTASPETSTGYQGVDQTENLLLNDTAGTSPIASIALCGTGQTGAACNETTVTVAGVGVYVLDPISGEIIFTPEPNFVGTATALPYVITDTDGATASSAYIPTVLATPAIPVGPTTTSDATTGVQGATQTKNLITNDNPGSSPIVAIALCGPTETAPVCTETTVTVAGVGIYVLDSATGVVTFTPESNFVGTPPALTYVITDGNSDTATATYTPTVTAAVVQRPTPQTPANPPATPVTPAEPVKPTTPAEPAKPKPLPIAKPDSKVGKLNQKVTLAPAVNDVKATAPLVETSIVLCTTECEAVKTAPTRAAAPIVTAQGSWSVSSSTGAVAFTPKLDWFGTATLKYVIFDKAGNAVQSTLTVVIPKPKVKPRALPKLLAYTGDTSLSASKPAPKPVTKAAPKLIATITAPRLGKTWVKNIYQGTSIAEVLTPLGLGHYEATQMPGEAGNFAIAGHRFGSGGPFLNIDKFKTGDRVYVTYKGQKLTYRFLQTLVVKPSAVGVLLPKPTGLTAAHSSDSLLTLQTCTPVHINTSRLIVWFEKVDTAE